MQQCLICSNNSFILLYDDTLLQCKKCGFVTANMHLTDHELKAVYNKEYFNGEEYQNYLEDKEVIQKNFFNRLKSIRKKINISSNASYLEIGCAYGFWGEIITRETSKPYLGYDVSEEAVSYAKQVLKLNVKTQNYLDAPLPEKNYTDVFMWDVIEHLKSPEKYLKKISDEIADQGRVYITTGNINSLLAKIQKKKWRMIHPPTHLHYFSKKTIKLLLEKNDFIVENIRYIPIYRSLRQIFYSLFILNKPFGKLSNAIYTQIPQKAFLKINTYDIMLIIATKTS
jgi:2-polyprenyl-3-methyl-5-hydroxy-6-metoxy-1,4-benzoquinol methylase